MNRPVKLVLGLIVTILAIIVGSLGSAALGANQNLSNQSTSGTHSATTLTQTAVIISTDVVGQFSTKITSTVTSIVSLYSTETGTTSLASSTSETQKSTDQLRHQHLRYKDSVSSTSHTITTVSSVIVSTVTQTETVPFQTTTSTATTPSTTTRSTRSSIPVRYNYHRGISNIIDTVLFPEQRQLQRKRRRAKWRKRFLRLQRKRESQRERRLRMWGKQ